MRVLEEGIKGIGIEIEGEKSKMKKGKIIQRIIRKYSIKHGDFIDINTLKFMAGKERMEVNDVMTILGISMGSRSRIRQNPFNKTRINIFDVEELKEIEISIQDEVKGMNQITEKRFNRLCNKYKINESILTKMLKISKKQSDKQNKGQKYIVLKSQNEEKKITNELFIEEVKYRDFINKEFIEYLKQKYKLKDEEICTLLEVKTLNYKNLMQMRTQKMRIDLIDEYEKREIEQKLIEIYKMQDYITKEEIIQTKQKIKTTNRMIKETLSISSEAFCRIMNDETRKTRITLKETKLKMSDLKMDIKYENEEGIYIGEEHPLSVEFVEKYEQRIENICRKMTNRYCYSSYLDTEKQDIAQEAFILVFQKGGNIEKNFSYNEDLLFNLLASKVKYFVIGKRNKRYQEVLLDCFDSYMGNYDEYDIFESHLSDSVFSMDSRIKLVHQHIMKIFKDNKDYIYHNRENAYKIIANKLKISIEKLERAIQEIRDIYLEYGFARKCMDGSIIDMSNVDSF